MASPAAAAAADAHAAPPAARVVGAWRLHAQIGAGSFASVHRAAHVQHGGAAAVKEIDTRRLSVKLTEALAGEVAVLRAASAHAHIVRLLDTIQARACVAARARV
jgi:serine/threonine protein kinase